MTSIKGNPCLAPPSSAAMGFEHGSHVPTAKILRLSEDLPFIVEIVDSQERIEAFLPELNRSWGAASSRWEKVSVVQYGRDAVT